MKLNETFNKDIIKYYKNNQHEITQELLASLRSHGNEGKQIAIDILDFKKDSEEYYLDAFNKKISFNGNRRLKKSYTKMSLQPIHKQEIETCMHDIDYFKKNYVKIITPNGVTFPELRKYQDDFIEVIIEDENESIVSLQPRQCCSASTTVEITFGEINETKSFLDLFNDCKENSKNIIDIFDEHKLSYLTNRKFIESYPGNGRTISTPNGYKEIIEVHKTIPYKKFNIVCENGLSLDCAYNHVIIDDMNNEHFAKDSLNIIVQTELGLSKIINVTDLNIEESMYDISIDSDDELYYSNGILSHNSGKTVTIGIYLAHKFLFVRDMNIGIAANKGKAAAEFLDKTKKILMELPIWLQAGLEFWNKTYIENENGVRIITDGTSSDSFRGFTCLEENTPINVFDKFENSQQALKFRKLYSLLYDSPISGTIKYNNRFLIETDSGFKEFIGMSETIEKGLIIKTDKEIIKCTKTHRMFANYKFICAKDLKIGDFFGNIFNKQIITHISEEKEEKKYYDPLNVKGNNTYTAQGITHHNCAITVTDECAFIKQNLWEGFCDSIFPSQSGLAWKKNILISTANGMNHFYDIMNGANNGTNGHTPYEVNWEDVPRYNSKRELMTNDEFKKSVVDKYGEVYFNQNYGNSFIGSSNTLISPNKLLSLKDSEIEEIRDGKLKIYEYPKNNHHYIMGVDPAKDGSDAFAIQIVDITDFKFKQVATAELQIDYLLMPEFINEWCEFYNKPYLIIENNEGAGQSIADQMYNVYEYENLHFDSDASKKNKVKARKKYPGFRTTAKTRKQIIQTMKLFIENDNLDIVDKSTINQFFHFILIANKYQADDSSHDDMIMSLGIVFVPFCNTKNFNDMKMLIDNLYKDKGIIDEEKINFTDLALFGSFDDFTDEDYHPEPNNGFDQNGFF